MAQIDLKKATIYIQDGYSLTGLVAATAPVAGAATMTTSGFSGAVAVGDTFTIGVGTQVYTVISHTETTGHTTTIGFAPVIPVGVTVTAGDAVTVGPHVLTVKLGEGNLTYTEKKARQYVKDRGKLSGVRNGDEDPVEVKLDFQWEFITASTGDPPTIEDALKKRGNASNWVSSGADPCEPYCVDLIIKYVPGCGAVENEIITLPEFRHEQMDHDPKAGTLATTGKCNVVEANAARVAAA